MTLHKCKPYFLSFICKRSQVEGRHVKHNPSCSSRRNEWQTTWSSFLRTLILSCISDKFQIKKKNGTKINLLTSHPRSLGVGKFNPKATRKEGSKGLHGCRWGVFVPFPSGPNSVRLRKCCCQSFSAPSSAKVLVWGGTPGCRAGLYPCSWLHST